MTPDRRFRTPGRCLLLAVTAAAGLLAACSSEEAAPPPCPVVVLAQDTGRLTRFEGSGRDLTDVLFEARIVNADLTCEYDDGTVEAYLRLLFEITRGPADTSRKAQFEHIVAITDREQNILVREEFQLETEFPGNRTERQLVDEIDQIIPLAEGKNGADYVVYVGLALSRDELDYNRRTAR